MVWAGICKTGKTPLIFVNPGVKINKDYYLREILQGFLQPGATLGIGTGFFNKIQHLLIRLEKCKVGVEKICLVSYHLKNGTLTVRILIRWTIRCGLFWRPGIALNHTKVWSRSVNHSSGNGRKSHPKRCELLSKIFPHALASVSKPRVGISKTLDCICSLFISLLIHFCLISLS